MKGTDWYTTGEGTIRYTHLQKLIEIMDTRDNRRHILEQALLLFSDHGYDAIGVQDIAAAAGVTKPTLYHYFGSKRGLLDTVLREHFGRLEQRVHVAAEYSGDLPLTLTRVVQAMFQFAREEPRFYAMILGMWFAPAASESHAATEPFLAALFGHIERLFQAAARDHGNMEGRHRSYAMTFLGMINTYIGLMLNDHVALDDVIVHQMVHQFSYGIYS